MDRGISGPWALWDVISDPVDIEFSGLCLYGTVTVVDCCT